MNQHREQYRILIERTGRLQRNGKVTNCHVWDLTELGFQVQTELDLSIGELVHLDCVLDLDSRIECALLITYARTPIAGGRIVDISPEHQTRLTRFIEQMLSVNLGGM
jgi:hypothetical protein